MNPKNFFAELKRRNVYKVAIAYAVVAWLLMQVASQIFPFFEIPNWAVRLVVLLLGVALCEQDADVQDHFFKRGNSFSRNTRYIIVVNASVG